MNAINEKLKEREYSGNPIVIGLIGAGQMGTEIVAQIGEMAGMEVAVVVDLTEEDARQGYRFSKKQRDIVAPKNLDEAEKAWKEGKYIAATDYRIATSLSAVEAVVDATGSTEMGGKITLDAVSQGKHVVMMSVECDVTIGPILRRMAENAGVVYTLASGDEPAAIMELYRFAEALGFQIVSVGKGKNNPLDPYATPEKVREKAEDRDMNPRMLCEFVDGSKTMVEMAAVSNATGLVPDVRGMHGPECTVEDLNKVFVPIKDGGIFRQPGRIDYCIGVAPGVFVIVTTDNQRMRDALVQRDMGEGPYYTLFRPYHLASIEVPLTVCRAVMYGESSGHPMMRELTSECIAVTKKELKKGDTLDAMGEYSYRGSIELAEKAQKEGLLPLGLANGCVLNQDIPRDTSLAYDMVSIEHQSILLELRRIQDMLFA